MPAARGSRSSTAKPSARSARSRWRRRIPKVIYVGTRRSRHAFGHRARRRHVPVHRWRQDVDRRSGLADSPADRAASSCTRAIPNIVYVAALGHPYGPNAERGVFRSRDGGRTWQKVLGPNARHRRDRRALRTRRIRASSMPRSGRRDGRLGTSIRRRTDPAAACTSPPTAATTGRSSPTDCPSNAAESVSRFHQAHRQRVYAIVDAEPGGGLYRSDDARRALDAKSATTLESGAAAGISDASPSIRRIPIASRR